MKWKYLKLFSVTVFDARITEPITLVRKSHRWSRCSTAVWSYAPQGISPVTKGYLERLRTAQLLWKKKNNNKKDDLKQPNGYIVETSGFCHTKRWYEIKLDQTYKTKTEQQQQQEKRQFHMIRWQNVQSCGSYVFFRQQKHFLFFLFSCLSLLLGLCAPSAEAALALLRCQYILSELPVRRSNCRKTLHPPHHFSD